VVKWVSGKCLTERRGVAEATAAILEGVFELLSGILDGESS
jgi:hypothetical protein